MFTPITTDRLLLRPMRSSDAEPLFARRNDPEVARYQNWTLPFERARATELVDSVVAMDGPENDEWWMLTVADRDDSNILGDMALHFSSEGRCAEIGYTLGSAHWGQGYAAEAATALVDWLFEAHPMTRVFGMLHPDNPASARVLERVGMTFEGHTRLSFWVGNDNSDDHIYGMTRDDWEAWRNRPKTPPSTIQLEELDYDTSFEAWRLKTHKTQEQFVCPMPESFADALFPETYEGHPLTPWLRGVRADGEMVAFVMLAEPNEHHPDPYLWRLLVDRIHQRRGIGKMTLDLVAHQCRNEWHADRLLTSWTEGRGSPEPFYLAYGFEKTGRIVDDETEGVLALT